MLMENTVSIYDFVNAIAETLDLASPALNNHHNRVAHIAGNIAQRMGLPPEEIQEIIMAAMLHDIGAFSLSERSSLCDFDINDDSKHHHAFVGYVLLKDFEPLATVAQLIKYHHADYDKSRKDIPLGSYIIHLADRVAIILDEDREVFSQLPEIANKIHSKTEMFEPRSMDAFDVILGLDYIWVDIFIPSLGFALLRKIGTSRRIVGLDAMLGFARMFAHIIDFRSRFTATHSSGVAAVAKELSSIAGFSKRESCLMEIAGYLHDLGKIAVPNSILEKQGPLNAEEFNIIKKHPYYTYAILNKIGGLEHIATWAAYHHERNDGNGYPFHVQNENFSKLSRIMVVADIFTALSEDRPYRLGMNENEAVRTLTSMSERGLIDISLVEKVQDNFKRIDNARIKAQKEAQKEYDAFHNADTLESFLFAA
ncbi:MAG: HD domain-containing protein [Coriobacteriales bacterium]|jgi:HD-GYP domain-containing protein (c-di-GMP phosphodiesterase class II)|nr:HD domain-containing protein [Coriobacteriales bacterium]